MSQKKYAVRLISVLSRLIFAFFALILILVLAFPIGFYGMAMYLEPSLPNVKEFKKMSLEMPLQIYTADYKLIGLYGNKYSLPVAYEEIPQSMIHAFLAAEDDTFFEHTGISVKGLGRAITQIISDDGGQTGGSSITQQVAKNYFLSPEQTFERKLNELFIARKIENELSKKEIFTLYVNKIYLGQGSYGIRAAAKRYFSKSLENLTIAEMAMLAGLPKAPSDFNPVVNPKRALERRNWIIGRMLEEGYISKAQHDEAINSPVELNLYQDKIDMDMPYISEMARNALVERYGNQVMDSGWRVVLTIDSQEQQHATDAVLRGLRRYDAGSGYRGIEAVEGNLANFKPFDDMLPAKIVRVRGGGMYDAELQSGEVVRVSGPGGFASKKSFGINRVDGKASETPRSISVGNIVRVIKNGGSWRITQPTRIQGALVGINPQNGALEAVVGGYHFNHSKFNRATQGYRQPGSIIKPLIYAAALDHTKLTPDSMISNAPLRIGSWRPKNAGGGFGGAVTMKGALAYSRNLPSIRIMQAVGIEQTHETLSQLGLEKNRLPPSFTLALGATDATPLQMATAYTTFINGGHRIQPYFVERIYNYSNQLIFQANPAVACATCFNKNLNKVNAEFLKEYNKLTGQADKEDGKEDGKAAEDKENIKADAADKKAKKSDDKTKEDSSDDGDTRAVGDKKVLQHFITAQNNLKDRISEFKAEHPTLDAAPIYDRLNPKQPIEYSIAEQAPRILSAKTAFQMASMLRGVVTGGTAKKASALGRSDIGGKTGTTNQAKDVWFAGVQPRHVAVVWLGFDDPASLGSHAFGGTLALPVWVDYMRGQLKGEPVKWVGADNIAKTKMAEQKVIEITDDNEAEAIKQLSEDDTSSNDVVESSGDEVIPEGDGEATAEEDSNN